MSKKKTVPTKKTATPKAAPTAATKKKPVIKEEIIIESTEVIEEGNVTIIKKETIEITEVEEIEVPKETPSEVARKRIAQGQALLENATQSFEVGNYPKAREILVDLAENHSNHETREQAMNLLGRMEMDVRTLMVGAVGMVMLLLIPTIGFSRALWMIPVLFLILLIDPNLFRAPEQND